MRHLLYWLGVLAGVGLLVGGVTFAILGYTKTAGPEGAVRGYFAALADGDASSALAYGDLPSGSTAYLTSEVLRAQLRIAPLRDVRVVASRQHGSRASVRVRYTLAFRGTDLPVSVSVPLHAQDGRWRLDRTAVRVELRPGAAAQRQSILGTRLPRGPILLFPGALPISLDTPYLMLDAYADAVDFASTSPVHVRIDVTAAGRTAMTRAVLAQVRSCVGARPSAACPLPDERYVPASVRGTVQDGMRAIVIVLDPHNAVGQVDFSGRATVNGSYRRLNFHNVQVAGRGPAYLDVRASAYAVPPLRVRWTTS